MISMRREFFARKRALTVLMGLFSLLFLGGTAAANNPLKDKYDGLIRTIASKYRVEDKLIHSIIRAESNYDRFAVSPKGALGLMQLMPETALEYGVKNVFDPQDNIEGGVKFLKDLIQLFSGRTDLVLAAYNAGQDAVKKYNGIPPYPETKNYIKKIMTDFGYGHSSIRRKTIIYKYYDERGRIVLTNNRELYLMNKDKYTGN